VTKKQLNKLRSTLIKACNAHVKAGGKIISGIFADGSVNGCCPVYCATADVTDDNIGYFDALNQKIGFEISVEDMWRLIDGIDFNSSLPGAVTFQDNNHPLFVLGQEIRKKYIKGSVIMSQATTAKEVLIAAKWILKNKGWCQNFFALTKNGEELDFGQCDPNLGCACITGAINMVEADKCTKAQALGLLPFDIIDWNDKPGRTKKQVISMLDKAIKKA
jgi:hypothetical protein